MKKLTAITVAVFLASPALAEEMECPYFNEAGDRIEWVAGPNFGHDMEYQAAGQSTETCYMWRNLSEDWPLSIQCKSLESGMRFVGEGLLDAYGVIYRMRCN